jgi:hypothetical protein
MDSRFYFHEDGFVKSKAVLYGITGYKVHAKEVERAHRSTASTLIATAPARTSKSYTFGHGEMTHSFFPKLEKKSLRPLIPTGNDAVRNWIVGTDYTTTKEWDYAWTDLIDNGLIEAMGGKVEKAQNNPQQGNMIIVATFGKSPDGQKVRSILQTKSATNERSLQGEAVGDGLLSEAAEHDERIVNKYLKTRCERLLLPTTPKRKALWLYEWIQAGDEDDRLGIDSFTFGPECNPSYDWARYEEAKLMAESRVGVGKASEDAEFAEQFLGMWVFEGGKVLPFRWTDMGEGFPSHVVDEPPFGIEHAEWFVSTDYGYDHPAVAHWWAKTPDDQVHIGHELYERNLNTSAFVQRIREISALHKIRPAYHVGDPRRPEVADLMAQMGLPLFPRNERLMKERAGSHAALVELMSNDPDTNMCRFSISSECKQTIIEWKHLRRKDGWTGDEHAAAAIQGRDDAYDCARYGACTVVRRRRRTYSDMKERHRRARLRARGQKRTIGPILVGPNPGMAS